MSPTQPTNFLIAGATGRQGSSVVDALLTHPTLTISPTSIHALTRSPTSPPALSLLAKYPSISLITGSLSNPHPIFAQLDPATLNSTAIFLAQAHGPTEVSDAKAFIDAAIKHGIPYFVYSSVDRGGREASDRDPSFCKTFSDKYLIEKHLIEACSLSHSDGKEGMEYTILRPVWFADNAVWGFPGKLCMTGWKVWMGGKKMQVLVLRDLGRWAVEGLVRPDRVGIRGMAVSVASDEVSFEEVDEWFSRKRGDGKGVDVVWGWLATGMIWGVKDLNTMFRWIDEREYGADLEWLAKWVEPTKVEDWVEGLDIWGVAA